MSEPTPPELRWVSAVGSPREVGRSLGESGQVAVRRVLLGSEYWTAVASWAESSVVGDMAERTRSLFPDIWQEIEGLAEGLDLPLMQVFAWNCRGDLMSNVPDGCTTVQLPGNEPMIGHNEDGLPGFRGDCFIAEVTPERSNSFIAFCYPGSIPGHTFAVTKVGIALAVNNLRLRGVSPQVPRMVLGRAVLSCDTLNEALALLGQENMSGGFHFTLGQPGDPRLLSVEFGGGTCECLEITEAAVHANHALRLAPPLSQHITRSSSDRQSRGTRLLDSGVRDPLTILRDDGGPGLPIHRDASDDPDRENTLGSVVMTIRNSAVEWKIYDQRSREPVYAGHVIAG